jgi:hypothetical protein
MMTRAEAVALRRTWKARAGTLTCLHHYLFVARINPKRSTKHFLCMDCGADVVRRFDICGNRPLGGLLRSTPTPRTFR